MKQQKKTKELIFRSFTSFWNGCRELERLGYINAGNIDIKSDKDKYFWVSFAGQTCIIVQYEI
jgi:hypothetical protein